MIAPGTGGLGAHSGPGWRRGPGRDPLCPGPCGFLGYCLDGLCSTITSCFYALCCCWLLQDCFGGSAGPQAPYSRLGSPGPPPPVPFGSQGQGVPAAGGPFEPPGPPGPPRLW